MALFYSDVQTAFNAPAFGAPPLTRWKANKLNGRIRLAEFMYVAPPSGTAPAIADKIIWGKLPVRSRFLGHLSKLYFNTGTAACTINLGDNVVAARHLAATAINATGSAVPEVASNIKTAVGDITIGSATIANVFSIGAFQYGANVVGTGIPLGSTVVGFDLQARTVTISAVATATTASLAITVNGGSYETADDSNSVANAFASTTDDCTLISVVAGAQIANNQAITLKVAYTQD